MQNAGLKSPECNAAVHRSYAKLRRGSVKLVSDLQMTNTRDVISLDADKFPLFHFYQREVE